MATIVTSSCHYKVSSIIYESIEQLLQIVCRQLSSFWFRSFNLFGCFRLVVSIRCKSTPTVGSLLLSFFVVKQIAHLYYGNKLCHLYSCMCFAILLCRWFCSYVAYFAPNHRHIFFRFSASCLLSLFFCSRFTFKYSSRPFLFVDVYAFAYAIYCRKAPERKERNGHLANCFVVFAYCRYISE